MVYIIKHRRERGIEIEDVSPEDYAKMKTVQGWIRENPDCWEKIKDYVYKNKLNKITKKEKVKRILTGKE